MELVNNVFEYFGKNPDNFFAYVSVGALAVGSMLSIGYGLYKEHSLRKQIIGNIKARKKTFRRTDDNALERID